MLNVIKSFVRDEDGLEMVEWAIVAALITTAAATALSALGGSVTTKFNDMDAMITGLP
jgi:Flp pilus assembly pilin Flp